MVTTGPWVPRMVTTGPWVPRMVGVPSKAPSSEDMQPDDKGSGKVRFVWSAELHARFEQAVGKLGVDRATPQAPPAAPPSRATSCDHCDARRARRTPGHRLR